MPTQPRRRHVRRSISHAAAALALAGCTTSGHGAVAAKTSLPTGHYDLAVYTCPKVSTCPAQTTPQQQQALRRALHADARVTHVLFLSQAASYRLAGRVLKPEQLRLIGPDDLPAAFLVSVGKDSDTTAVSARFRAAPGVGSVLKCATLPNCSLSALRAARVVK